MVTTSKPKDDSEKSLHFSYNNLNEDKLEQIESEGVSKDILEDALEREVPNNYARFPAPPRYGSSLDSDFSASEYLDYRKHGGLGLPLEYNMMVNRTPKGIYIPPYMQSLRDKIMDFAADRVKRGRDSFFDIESDVYHAGMFELSVVKINDLRTHQLNLPPIKLHSAGMEVYISVLLGESAALQGKRMGEVGSRFGLELKPYRHIVNGLKVGYWNPDIIRNL